VDQGTGDTIECGARLPAGRQGIQNAELEIPNPQGKGGLRYVCESQSVTIRWVRDLSESREE
jgi:hypothetical protein